MSSDPRCCGIRWIKPVIQEINVSQSADFPSPVVEPKKKAVAGLAGALIAIPVGAGLVVRTLMERGPTSPFHSRTPMASNPARPRCATRASRSGVAERVEESDLEKIHAHIRMSKSSNATAGRGRALLGRNAARQRHQCRRSQDASSPVPSSAWTSAVEEGRAQLQQPGSSAAGDLQRTRDALQAARPPAGSLDSGSQIYPARGRRSGGALRNGRERPGPRYRRSSSRRP